MDATPGLRKRRGSVAKPADGGAVASPSSAKALRMKAGLNNAKDEELISPASSSQPTPRVPTSGVVISTKPVPANGASSSAPTKESCSPFFLTVGHAFALLSVVRLAATMAFGLIGDCDESFNYWEPSHYLLYGSGLQTWEYSPQYAFRSYAYVGLHSAIGWITGAAWGADKIAVFHRTRYVLALACALAEAVFVSGVATRFGRTVGHFTLVALLTSGGMAHAAPSYLPSTWTMVWLTAAWGLWLRGDLSSRWISNTGAVVAATVTGLLLGWPFAVVALVPFGLHLLASRSIPALILHGGLWTALVIGVSALVDKHYYGKWVIAAYNIILYNAFGVGGGGQGSDLYGVEPPQWYAQNLVLNFNVYFVQAALSPLAVLLAGWKALSAPSVAAAGTTGKTPSSSFSYLLCALAQLWLWFGLMSSRPHKEERFMFPVFPLIPLAAAVSLYEGLWLLDAVCSALLRACCCGGRKAAAVVSSPSSARLSPLSKLLAALAIMIGGTLSASRLTIMIVGYSAPFKAWEALGRHLQYAVPSTSSSTMNGGHTHGHPGAKPVRPDFERTLISSVEAAVPLLASYWNGQPPSEVYTTAPATAGSGSCCGKASKPLTSLGGPSRDHAPAIRSALQKAPPALTSLLPAQLPAWYQPQEAPSAAEVVAARADISGSSMNDVTHGASLSSSPLVCVGKEWYRFPSAYFLPETTKASSSSSSQHTHHGSSSSSAVPGPAAVFAFIKSGFGGLLPQPYLPQPGQGSTVARSGFNDENKEEPDRYVPYSACDYVIDFALPVPREQQDARYEPHFDLPPMGSDVSDEAGCAAACEHSAGSAAVAHRYRSIAAFPFLHADSTPSFARSFYIPRVTEKHARFGAYHVLARVDCACPATAAAAAAPASTSAGNEQPAVAVETAPAAAVEAATLAQEAPSHHHEEPATEVASAAAAEVAAAVESSETASVADAPAPADEASAPEPQPEAVPAQVQERQADVAVAELAVEAVPVDAAGVQEQARSLLETTSGEVADAPAQQQEQETAAVAAASESVASEHAHAEPATVAAAAVEHAHAEPAADAAAAVEHAHAEPAADAAAVEHASSEEAVVETQPDAASEVQQEQHEAVEPAAVAAAEAVEAVVVVAEPADAVEAHEQQQPQTEAPVVTPQEQQVPETVASQPAQQQQQQQQQQEEEQVAAAPGEAEQAAAGGHGEAQA